MPESLYAVYLDNYVYSYLKTVYEGWAPKSYAVSVASPGQFGNELLNVMEKWAFKGFFRRAVLMWIIIVLPESFLQLKREWCMI